MAYYGLLLNEENKAHVSIFCFNRLKTEAKMKKNSQGSRNSSQESFSQDTPIETLSSKSDGVNINIQDVLLEAYRQIGDPDGVYGCGAGRLADTTSR